MFETFFGHFWNILGTFWGHIGNMLGTCLRHFGNILGIVGDFVGKLGETKENHRKPEKKTKKNL